MLALVILDGLGDEQNTFMKAKKPNIEFFMEKGSFSWLKPLDFAPESDESMLTLLGIPLPKWPARGFFEAVGAGFKINKDWIYLRCNIASYRKGQITELEARINEKKKREIEKKLNKIGLPCEFEFRFTAGHRAVLVLKEKLDERISSTNPGYVVIKKKFERRKIYVSVATPNREGKVPKARALVNNKKARKTAEIVNKFVETSSLLLKDKVVVTRGASKPITLPKLKKWFCITTMPVEKGIAKLAGMKIIKMPLELKKMARLVLKLIKKGNVWIQIKAPDKWAHRGNCKKKKEEIEKIDRLFFSQIKKYFNFSRDVLCITGDHSTSCSTKAHTNKEVPCVVVPLQIKRSLKGYELLKIIKKESKNN